MKNLIKNHVQPPFLRRRVAFSFFIWSCTFFAGSPALVPSAWYRLCVSMLMMSWLSNSSPVSAVRPRYVTDGILTLGTLKHVSHCSASGDVLSERVRDLSCR